MIPYWNPKGLGTTMASIKTTLDPFKHSPLKLPKFAHINHFFFRFQFAIITFAFLKILGSQEYNGTNKTKITIQRSTEGHGGPQARAPSGP